MISVYLVDDHVIMREGLRAVLESANFRVLGEADNTTTALADIVRLEPDAVLLDLSLADGASGLDLLQRLKGRGLRTRVIVLTMLDQPRTIAEAIRSGAAGYVLKGSGGADVVRSIHEVVQGKRYFSPNVADRAIAALTGDQATDPLASLSARERQILEMVVKGLSSAAIGAALHLTATTVNTYRSRLMTKLGVHDVPSLVRVAIREGIIDAHSD
jgi:DNA-binding NarL/FixJ family response regulator